MLTPFPTLTASEQNHLIKLFFDRNSKELYHSDPGVLKRVMNNLCKKGMAEAIDTGWKITQQGQACSLTIS